MAGETQRQLLKENQTLLADLKKVKDQIARLEKRHKAQGQRPQQGERRFGDAPEAVYVEPKPPDPSRINQHPTSQTHTHHVANSRFDHKSFADKIELFTFSGGRSYLFWERNLDEWFHYNNILKEERLSYAIDQLRGNAFKWWVQEEDDRWFYKEPAIKTWRDLKEVMRDEFSPELTSSKIRKIYPRRYLTHVSKEKPEPVIVQEKAKDVKTGPEVEKDTISTSLLESKVVHDLSLRDKEILNPKKEEPSSQSQNSCMMHLSLSKGDVTGTKEHEFKGEEPPGATPVMDQKMVQDTMQSILLKEAKPVLKVSHQGRINETYKLIEVAKKEPDHKLSHELTPKWKPKSEQSIVQVPKPMI
ncbi:uncharacterized protein LOC125601748 [Brassica napus]|uniref:uncharacterized protein LOC125601748 n=1 Tax=Brassica napus TaxID=3708 RepID=UPI0006AAFD9D|nr:uncharacterized protein LOC125601748 [Brassica napus]